MQVSFCVVLLSLVAHVQAEPTASPTLGPSASPAPSPLLRRSLRKSMSAKGKGSESTDLLDGSVGPLNMPSPSARPDSITQSSKLPTVTSAQVPEAAAIPTVSPLTAQPTIPPKPMPYSEPTNFPTLGASDFPSSLPSMIPTETLTSSSFLELTDESTSPPSLGPSSVPSLEQSDIPSSEPSDVPSSLPIEATIESCNLVATIDCRLEDGTPCSSLSAVPTDNESCTGRPYELEWLYKAGSCNESTTKQEFQCSDENGGPSSVFLAYMTITGGTSNVEYFSRIIFPGVDGFPVQSAVLKSNSEGKKILDESIKVVIRKGSPSGGVLQEMTLSIACDDDDDSLKIGDSFGALQLTSYRSKDTSSIQSSASITWIYTAENMGNAASVLKSMASGTNGVPTTVSPDVSLSPGDEYHIVAHETISLAQPASFRGELTILEDSATNECWATSNYTFGI